MPKAFNPANGPEVRPAEDFWTESKRLVYDDAWEAKNLEQLRNRINYAFKKVDMKRVHALGNASFTRVDTVRRHVQSTLFITDEMVAELLSVT